MEFGSQVNLIALPCQHADSVFDFYNTVCARFAVRTSHVVFADTQPRVLVNRSRSVDGPRAILQWKVGGHLRVPFGVE